MYIDLQNFFVFVLLGCTSYAVFYAVARLDTWVGDRKYNRIKK